MRCNDSSFRPIPVSHCFPRLAALILALGSSQPSAVFAQSASRIPDQTDIARAACDRARAAELWAEAFPVCQVVLQAAEQKLRPQDPSVAYWQNEVGLILRHLARYSEAEPLIRRSLRIREQALGTEHPDVTLSLGNLAGLYEAQGRYSDAEPLFQRSLRILQKVRGDEHPLVGLTLRRLAQVCNAQGRYPEAELLLQRSLHIFEKVQGFEHSDVLTALNLLATFYRLQGRYSEAEPLYQRRLHSLEEALGPEHPDVASALDHLARLYKLQNRYTEAISVLQRRLRIVEKASGTVHVAVAEVLFDLADTFWWQQRPSEAEEYFQRGFNMAKRVLTPKEPWTPFHVYMWGTFHYLDGQYEKAERLILLSLELSENARRIEDTPDTRALITATLIMLAMVYEDRALYEDAERFLRRSLEIAEKDRGLEESQGRQPLRPFGSIREFLIGQADPGEHELTRLAGFYMRRDDPAKAIPMLERLFDRGLRSKTIFDARLLDSLGQLAMIYRHLERNKELGALWTRLVSELSQARGSSHGLNQEVRSKLALLLERAFFHFWQERRFEEASKLVRQVGALPLAKESVIAQGLSRLSAQLETVPQAERSLLEARARFAKGHEDAHAVGLFERGFEAVALGRTAEALRFLREGLYLGDAHLRRQKSVKAVAEWLERTQPFLQLIWELARTQPQEKDAVLLAWTATLLSKGRTLDTETKALRLLTDSKASQQHPLLWSMHQEVKNRVRQEAVAGIGSGALHALGQQARDAEATLSQSVDSARIEVLPEPFELVRAVATKLPKDGVLVDFVEYAPPQRDGEAPASRYLALLLFPAEAPQDPRMQLVDLGEVRTHGPGIAALLQALRNPASQPERLASAVYDALMAPVRKAAGTVTQIWLVPDGALNLIPFDALHDGDRYVVDSSVRIRYLASGRDLIFSFRLSSGQPPLVLGNPELQAVSARPAPVRPEQKPPAAGRGKVYRGVEVVGAGVFDRLSDLSCLPDAEREAADVAKLVHVTPLLGAEASEPALRDMIQRGRAPRILHMAMHGVFPDDLTGTTVFGARSRSVPVPFVSGVLTTPVAPDASPELHEPMLHSALLLAGAAKAREATRADADGILTADEARELPLEGTELVVLSACQTALGSIRAGDGVYGLRRAFLAAGAETVVASLWRVADQPTHSLMKEYYDRLITGRQPRIQAMREAMLEVKKAHPHPYYWAPFIAIGRDAPIELRFPH